MSERKRCELCGHFLDKHEPDDRKGEIENWLLKEARHKPYPANVHPVAARVRLGALRAMSEEEVQERKARYEKELKRLKRKSRGKKE
jgi:ATP-dependent helicase YprA (DUF1998 family)